MVPEDIPNSITAAELAALTESADSPAGPNLGPPGSVPAGEASWLNVADPLAQQMAGLLAPAVPAPSASGGGRATPGASDLERQILGEMADPGARQAVEDLAGRIRRAIAAGATEAARFVEGRVPQVDDEVIFRDAPFRVLRVRDPGPKPRLDLISFRRGEPEVVAAVQADLAAGWSWLGEPDPPEPTGEDRVRAALAAGRPIPAIGSVVTLMRAKPPSYRGVETVALRAKVVARVDVVGQVVELDLEILDPPVDGLDAATSTGVVRVQGPFGPHDRREGWSNTARGSTFEKPDDRKFHGMPCQRCGAKLSHDRAVQFLSRTHHDHTNPVTFAQLCMDCSDTIARSFFIKPAASEPAATDDDDLDELA